MARKNIGLAAEYALAAEKTLDPAMAKDLQMKLLLTVHRTLLDAGKITDMQGVAERLAALEKVVDRDYLTTVPSFQGVPFAGRKGQSQRVVLMELFTVRSVRRASGRTWRLTCCRRRINRANWC